MNFKKFHESKNLFNYKRDKATTFTTDTKYYMIGAASVNDVNVGASVTITDSGVKVTSTIAGYGASFFIEVTPNTDYTISVSCNKASSGSYFSYSCRDASGNVISGSPQSAPTTTQTITAPANAKFLNICLRFPPSDGEVEYTNVMLNEGSTPQPYEPYSSEVWHDIPHYIHNTSTDTITTLPDVIYPTDTTATVGLKGQAVQSGTPTPDNPVMPNGTGERTGNLFDESTIEVGGLSPTTGAETTDNTRRRSGFISVEPNTNYGLSREITSSGSFFWVIAYDENKNIVTDATISAQYSGAVVTGTTLTINQWTFTTTPTTKYIRWYVTANNSYKNIMLNTGSSPLPFEPYGIKIPILSANTTTPVYLGEVETTRRVKKLVLDGNTSISPYSSGATGIGFITQGYRMLGNRILGISSHFRTQSTGAGSTIDGVTFGINNTTIYFTFSANSVNAYNLSDLASIRQYLAQQYAAGTPVTVWYVLAEPETAVVNEPLMKIGNYVDTVSDITIPTIAGVNTISVDTTLQPSEVTVNYKGWHPVQSVHEYDSNYTIATMQALTIAQLQTHTISDLQGGEWS